MLQRAGESRYQRSTGRIAIVAGGGAHGGLRKAFQEGCGKVRFPRRSDGLLEAMVLNTAGGLAGGDRFSLDVAVEAGTLITSTQASERVYRAEGGPAGVEQHLRVGDGGRLLHLPQPTLLYDRAGLHRRTRIDLCGNAALTFCEGLVLGREAMGEVVRAIALSERTMLSLDGRLALADVLRLDNDALARADRAAMLGGARGIGLVLHSGGDLDAGLDLARVTLGPLGAASIVGGVLVARLLAPSHKALQDGLARLVTALSGVRLPRAWQL